MEIPGVLLRRPRIIIPWHVNRTSLAVCRSQSANKLSLSSGDVARADATAIEPIEVFQPYPFPVTTLDEAASDTSDDVTSEASSDLASERSSDTEGSVVD